MAKYNIVIKTKNGIVTLENVDIHNPKVQELIEQSIEVRLEQVKERILKK